MTITLSLFLNDDDYRDAGNYNDPLKLQDVFDFHVSLTYNQLSILDRSEHYTPILTSILSDCALYGFIGKVIDKVKDNIYFIDCNIPILIQSNHLLLGDIVEGYGCLYCNSIPSTIAYKYRMGGKVINIIKYNEFGISKPIYLLNVEVINNCLSINR